eukprot:94295-Rhodomonas_salina.2
MGRRAIRPPSTSTGACGTPSTLGRKGGGQVAIEGDSELLRLNNKIAAAAANVRQDTANVRQDSRIGQRSGSR